MVCEVCAPENPSLLSDELNKLYKVTIYIKVKSLSLSCGECHSIDFVAADNTVSGSSVVARNL